MVAAILGRSPSTISNAPDVGDVHITADMLGSLGASVAVVGDQIAVDPSGIEIGEVPMSFSGLNRIPILFIGPLLHRLGEVFVPTIGGDRIGRRPVNFHTDALRAMGAQVTVTEEGIRATATKLHGTRIRLPYPSVGATESILLSAVFAEGRTVLENSAIEPEVIELALFLQRMGARLELRPDRRFVIEGVEHLEGANHRLAGDRIEAFSYLCAGLVTGGEVRVFGCAQDRLVTAISTLHRMGVHFEINDDYISASARDGLVPAVVKTDTHPGFMTDWQSPLVVLFTQVDGMSVLHETVYEDRLSYVPALKQMGAEVELFDACLGGPGCRFYESTSLHSVVVHGVNKLRGAEITIPDIRGGFAYLIAAAAAEGESILHDVHHIERGYADPYNSFTELGLHLKRL